MMNISEQAHSTPLNDDELTRIFNEIDDDGNGYITPREAKKAFKKLAEKFNISRVSAFLFTLNTNSIGFNVLLNTCLSSMGIMCSAKKCEMILLYIDINCLTLLYPTVLKPQ